MKLETKIHKCSMFKRQNMKHLTIYVYETKEKRNPPLNMS